MIVGTRREGRKIRAFLRCDNCGKATQQVWIWDLSMFLPGKEKRDCVSQNASALKKLADCEDFEKDGKRHVCASCVGEIAPPQLSLFGGTSC